jgi:hypothetical protein
MKGEQFLMETKLINFLFIYHLNFINIFTSSDSERKGRNNEI